MVDTMCQDLDHLVKARILFIGGAPRSGTSALVRAFDWHPDVLMFPFEIDVIRQSFSLSGEALKCYLQTGLFEASAGKQATLANNILLARLLADLRTVYHYNDAVGLGKVDPVGFRAAYQAALSELGRFDLYAAVVALHFALLTVLPELRQRSPHPKFLAVKVPFWVEFYAINMDAQLPQARYVHIMRDPLSRYISAKLRSVRSAGAKSEVGPMNGADYPSAQTDITISSARLARTNQRRLVNRYHVVGYERLVANRCRTMSGLCEALDITWNDCLLQQTLLGQSQRLPSSFGFINASSQGDVARRWLGKWRWTSSAERNYLRLRFACVRDARLISDERFVSHLVRCMRERFYLESEDSHQRRQEWLETSDWGSLAEESVVARTSRLAQDDELSFF